MKSTTSVPPLEISRTSHTDAPQHSSTSTHMRRTNRSTISAPNPPPPNPPSSKRTADATFRKLTQQLRNDPSKPATHRTIPTNRSTPQSPTHSARSSISGNASPGGSARSVQSVLSDRSFKNEMSSARSSLLQRPSSASSQRSYSKQQQQQQKSKLYSSYQPAHLTDVDYQNDIFEVLKDKIDSQAGGFHNTFKRLNKSVGYLGLQIPREEFKKALIRDFHLFDDLDKNAPDQQSIAQYQNMQKQKLDEFLDKADDGNGNVRYNDFIRALSTLDKQVSSHSTTKERQARFSSTMNNQLQKILEQRNMESMNRKVLKPPPFALCSDSDSETITIYSKYVERLDLLRSCFGSDQNVSYDVFKRGLMKFDHYMSESDVKEIIHSLDPARRGSINVEEFMNRFAVEMLKSKSLRGTAENGFKSMQWPYCFAEVKPRTQTMEELRIKNSKSSIIRRSKGTRSQTLRNDAIQRNGINQSNRAILSSTGFLSNEQRAQAEIPFYHRSTRPSSANPRSVKRSGQYA